MSSDISALEQALISDYINTSANVLFLFDCVITLSQEVDVIWRRKWNATTWLYAFTRYGIVMDMLILLLPIWNSVSCKFMVRINQALTLTQYLCLAWFSALRVYALLDGKYLVPALVLLLNVIPFATNIFNYATSTVLLDAVECVAVPRVSNDLVLSAQIRSATLCIYKKHATVSLTTRISVIIGDVLVLAVTWTKTAQAYQEARRLNIRAPLATMLFRDGTIYFLILLVLNIFQMIENNVPVLFSLNIIVPFSNIIPSMIVCHFILNLRQIEPAGSSWASANRSHSLRFVGNMGQSLQFGDEDANGEDEGVPGAEGPSAEGPGSSWPEITIEAAEDREADKGYVRPTYHTEQEPTYADV